MKNGREDAIRNGFRSLNLSPNHMADMVETSLRGVGLRRFVWSGVGACAAATPRRGTRAPPHPDTSRDAAAMRNTEASRILFGDPLLRVHDGVPIWTPADAPIPASHPLDGGACMHGTFNLSRTFPGTDFPSLPMCLLKNDYVSNSIQRTGSWRDCKLLIDEWNRGLDKSESSLQRSTGQAIFMDVGANQGACTLEMLLRTDARIIAFEPNPANQFHLSRTLSMIARLERGYEHRVALIPVGLGARAANVGITLEISSSNHKQKKTNAGNSVLGTEATGTSIGKAAGDEATVRHVGNVPVRRMDEIFAGAFPVRLVKMDVQVAGVPGESVAANLASLASFAARHTSLSTLSSPLTCRDMSAMRFVALQAFSSAAASRR